VPTLNAGASFVQFLTSLRGQSFLPATLLLLDSESDDGTVALARDAGFMTIPVARKDFNHGSTRQFGVNLCPNADAIIFMTQDAILASADSIKNLISPFSDPRVGASYGRQLPRADALAIAAHARLFNYPEVSSVKSKEDIAHLGIKAAFLSDSCAAYRRTIFMEVGAFPGDVIFGEDTYLAAKMLQAGWKIAYVAEATCFHSHNYRMTEEFRRYFDIGVFHSRENWFITAFGKPEKEGEKFVISELRYLYRHSPWLIPSSFLRTGLKLLGYKLGLRERDIPLWLKLQFSLNKGYWRNG
jgi:rhamnosyltransferase